MTPTPTPAALLRRLAYTWIRGPAVRAGDQIVLDTHRAQTYEPMRLERNVGIALARVRTPEDAVTFATAFGLLTQPSAYIQGEPIPATLSQSWFDFEREATEMRRLLNTTLDVRRAVAGDRQSLALRAALAEIARLHRQRDELQALVDHQATENTQQRVVIEALKRDLEIE